MKVILLMFDSLNRRHLPPYGGDPKIAPNFARLAQRSLTFDTSYVCSMPCMPARRDLHTGRPNFLHRFWGPLEPFDVSVFDLLQKKGISSHLITDHYHYFEDGGATYHPRYSTYQFFRGQEGDPWMGQVRDPIIPPNINGKENRQDWVNRSFIRVESDFPQAQTIAAGLDFIERNHDQDHWVLQLETFDPHEPFVSPESCQKVVDYNFDQPTLFDWPGYRPVQETPEEIEQCRKRYDALLHFCDRSVGKVLDAMDRHNLWKDTMLVVWTDHGFLLGEHGCWAKNWMPLYEEVARTPFFIWDPRSGEQNERRASLVQPAIDLAPTLLDFFGLEPDPLMRGKSLRPVIENDTPIREFSLFGYHGGWTNLTDGRHVYLRAPEVGNAPLYHYTAFPTQMRGFLPQEQLRTAETVGPLPFTRGLPVTRYRVREATPEIRSGQREKNLLFDLQADPKQEKPLENPSLERHLMTKMRELMIQAEAPPEQFERMGL